MYCLANLADGPAVVDFICPYDQNRHDYDIKIWMNTIKEGRMMTPIRCLKSLVIVHLKLQILITTIL